MAVGAVKILRCFASNRDKTLSRPQASTSARYNNGHRGDASGSRRLALKALVASMTLANMSSCAAVAGEDWASLPEEEWRKRLAPDSFQVLRRAGTERPFSSPLNKEYRPGMFCCAGCGSKLFNSSAKFNSGTGWPSFTQALPGAVDESEDRSIIFMPRTEVTCHTCHGHLGHVFPDGPQPTGLRYCMNGVALSFVPDES